jgi:hypothetical protein
MPMSKKKEPLQNTNPVGYGKPPVHTRFRKGKSGNPTGKRKHGEAAPAEALIWQEVHRLLTVREDGKVTRMPALQVVARSLTTCAAKGNVPAQRAFVKIVQDIEDARARRTGHTATRKLNKHPNEITDEELMDVVKAAKNDKL